MKKKPAPRDKATFLVGYCGSTWSGGAFPSDAKTPEEAAAQLYEHASSGFPKGDTIKAARMTSLDPLGGYHLDLVGEDPSKPESWKVNASLSHPPKARP